MAPTLSAYTLERREQGSWVTWELKHHRKALVNHWLDLVPARANSLAMSMICPLDRISFILNTSEGYHAVRFSKDNCLSWLKVTSVGSSLLHFCTESFFFVRPGGQLQTFVPAGFTPYVLVFATQGCQASWGHCNFIKHNANLYVQLKTGQEGSEVDKASYCGWGWRTTVENHMCLSHSYQLGGQHPKITDNG